MIRALLRTQGYLVAGALLTSECCTRLSEDVRRSADAGPHVVGPGGAVRAIALLIHSELALELLDEEAFGAMVDKALGGDVILSRAEGALTPRRNRPEWQRDFDTPRRSLPARSFRPGVALWVALGASGGEIEVLRASQHMEPKESPPAAGITATRIALSQGRAVLLEGGISYRLLSPETPWLCFSFVRPWVKPEVLLYSALGEERMSRLGARGRRWCGAHLRLPTSVEEFLAIEQAALESDFGRAKGSGI